MKTETETNIGTDVKVEPFEDDSATGTVNDEDISEKSENEIEDIAPNNDNIQVKYISISFLVG